MSPSPSWVGSNVAARQLLQRQPIRPVHGCPEIVAHQAVDVLELWQRWEAETGARQEPPFWASVWPGAALLGRALLDQPELVRDREVIDLGCGSGIVAIAAKLAGARSAVANDCDPIAVDAAFCNAALNDVELKGHVGDLTLQKESFSSRHVIVICEMFYERTMAARLCEFVSRAHGAGASVLVADGERAFLPVSELELLREQDVPVDLALEGVSQRRARLFRWHAPVRSS
jgi:predicted nicotinamide N-methyase